MYGISRLSTNTLRRAVPIVRKLVQTGLKNLFKYYPLLVIMIFSFIERLQTTNFYRFSSTGTDQQKQNNENKSNMTNLLYIVGGLAGAGIVYSLVSIFISFTLINRFVKMQCSSSF